MINKRQVKNRKRLANLTIIILTIEIIMTFGIIGNIELEAKTNIFAIWFYIINSIFSIILIELCNYLKIEI